jgi:hypothetical protein
MGPQLTPARWLLSTAVLAVIGTVPAVSQWQQGEPTKQEIADAYRSKSGEHVLIIPGIRWETWSIRQIRGWSLKFKRVSEQRGAGVLTRRYRAVAKKNGQCAEYQIADTVVFRPAGVHIKPSLTVDPGGVKACR